MRKEKEVEEEEIYIFFTFSLLGKTDKWYWGKKVAIFNREWGQNSAPREGTIIS